ncbi:MAG: acyltransferase [Chitinophagaceae bacterium]|nr:acyltransferase [Chitinophagaceae bacterium]
MLKTILNKYISGIKGEAYRVDPQIRPGYLLHLMLTRVLMKIRGKMYFPMRQYAPFIGRYVTLKAKSSFQFGAGLSIGNGVVIDALSTSGIRLGNNVSVGYATRIECTGNLRHLGKGLTVGDNVGLGTDCFYGCAGGIRIGDDTIIGNFVSFHSENHIYADPTIPIRLQGVTHQGIVIGKNCWIGAKTTILDGTIVGDGCIIAAGAVLKGGMYNANGIYGGVPAKLLKYRNE